MPEIERPDGAVIHYETFGEGFPLLCFAPGGVNSQIDFWSVSAINPIEEFASDFMVIGMDQRNAGKSPAPAAPAPYDVMVADQIAVLDDLGVERAHTFGGCIGVAFILRIAQEAPGRITTGVGQDPVGLNHTNSVETFMDMFRPTLALARGDGVGAVVEAAMANPVFMANNAAGPFARRIHDDAAFRDEMGAMSADAYVSLIEAYADAIWPDRPPYFSVDEDVGAHVRDAPADPAGERPLPPHEHRRADLSRRTQRALPRCRLPQRGEAGGYDRSGSQLPEGAHAMTMPGMGVESDGGGAVRAAGRAGARLLQAGSGGPDRGATVRHAGAEDELDRLRCVARAAHDRQHHPLRLRPGAAGLARAGVRRGVGPTAGRAGHEHDRGRSVRPALPRRRRSSTATQRRCGRRSCRASRP